MSGAYTAELRLGSWSTTITEGVAPTTVDGTAPVVLDGLRMAWRYAGGEWPAVELDPLTASLELAVADVAVLRALSREDLASVVLRDRNGEIFASVYGRVAELTAEQTRRNGRVWTRYTVEIADHLAFVDEPISLELPFQWAHERWPAVVAAAETPVGLPTQIDKWWYAPMWPYTADAVGLATVLRDHLAESIRPYTTTTSPERVSSGRPLTLAAVADGAAVEGGTGSGDLWGLVCLDIGGPTLEADNPATLTYDGTELRMVAATTAGARDRHAVAATEVELAGSWRQEPVSAADGVTVRTTDPATNKTTSATVYAPGVKAKTVRNRRWYDVTILGTSALMAEDYMYYPGQSGLRDLARSKLPPLALGGWDRDTFTWRVPDPTQLGRQQWFPDFATRTSADIRKAGNYSISFVTSRPSGSTPACLYRPVVITGIPDEHNLASSAGVYAGMLTGAELALVDGRVVLTFGMVRQLPRVESTVTADSLTYEWLRSTYPAAQLRQLDPGLTFADTRILRRNR